MVDDPMESLAGKTGIVIHAGVHPGGGGTVGKLLHAVHLDKVLAHWGASMAKDFLMVINVDGTERREPFYEAHFVECGPGEHDVAVQPAQSTAVVQPVFWAAKKMKVTVAAGEIVHLTYTLGGVGQVSLALGQTNAAT
jgi:hypothetical protein